MDIKKLACLTIIIFSTHQLHGMDDQSRGTKRPLAALTPPPPHPVVLSKKQKTSPPSSPIKVPTTRVSTAKPTTNVQVVYPPKKPSECLAPKIQLSVAAPLEIQKSSTLELFSNIKNGIYNFDPTIESSLATPEANDLTPDQRRELFMTGKNIKKAIRTTEKATAQLVQITNNPEIKNKFDFTQEIDKIRAINRSLRIFQLLPNLELPQTIFTPPPFCNNNIPDTRPKPSDLLIALCEREKKGIFACCYHITLDPLIETLIKKKKEGVPVEIITNQTQGPKPEYSAGIKKLYDNGIMVLAPQKKYEQMHHKFFIFYNNILGKLLVFFGSYNPTPYGNSNSWDGISVSDHPRTVQQHQDQYVEVKTYSTPIIF